MTDSEAFRPRDPGNSDQIRLLRGAIAGLERELGSFPVPDGLLELHPNGPEDPRLRILFAAEPAGLLLIGVVDGPIAVRQQHAPALLLSAAMLRLVRAGKDPEATAYRYDRRGFLADFYPRDDKREPERDQ